MENYKVYYLKSKSEDQLRYIGITKSSLKRRLSGHKTKKEHNQHKVNWINKHGNDVEIYLIQGNIQTLQEANEIEVYLIKHYRDLGYDLLNKTEGGDGTKGTPCTESKKELLRTFNKGKTLTEEHRSKISNSHKGKKMKENTRKLQSILKYIKFLEKNGINMNINDFTFEEIMEERKKILDQKQKVLDLQMYFKKIIKLLNNRGIFDTEGLNINQLNEKLSEFNNKVEEEKNLIKLEKQKLIDIQKEKTKERNLKKKQNKIDEKKKIENQKIIEKELKKRLRTEESERKVKEGLLKKRVREDGKILYTPIVNRDNFPDALDQKAKKYSGANSPTSKLSEEDVREIRRLFAEGIKTQKEISIMYKMDYTTINKIIKRSLWKHLE